MHEQATLSMSSGVIQRCALKMDPGFRRDDGLGPSSSRRKPGSIFTRYALVLLSLAVGACFVASPPAHAQSSFSGLLTQQSRLDEIMTRARAALDAGRIEEGAPLIQEVLQADPNHVEANFRAGTILWLQRNYQQALAFMQKSSDLAPNNASLHLSVGGYYEQINLLPQAVQHYRSALQLLDGSPEYKTAEKRTNLALVKDYAAKGDMDSALQLLNALVEEYPDDTRVMQHLGFSYLIANRFQDAANVYKNVIAREPQNDAAYLNLAGVYEKMPDVPNALATLNKVVELNLDAARVNEAKARISLLQAQLYQQQNQLDAAVTELKKVLNFVPNHPLALLALASIYREQKRFDDAEESLTKVVRTSPDNMDAHLKLGTLYLEVNDYIDAIWELDTVIARGGTTPLSQQARMLEDKLQKSFGDQVAQMRKFAEQKNQFKQRVSENADDVEAHFNLAVVFVNQGLTEKARREFEEVKRIDPLIARTYLNLAELNAQLGHFIDAGDAMLRYVSLEKDIASVEKVNVAFATFLAQKLFEEDHREAALFQFERVLAVTPDEALPNYYKGLIVAQKGQMKDAITAYEKVIEKAPGHMGARTNLALLYEQLGKEEDALAQYKRITLASAPGPLRDSAEKRATFLQRAVNGLTSTAGYSLTIDNNSNLSEVHPTTEYSSSLSGSFSYRFKYSDNVRVGMAISPTYTTYHIGHYDFLSTSYDPFWNWGDPQQNYTLRYNYTDVSGVLNQANVNTQQAITGEYSRTVFGEYGLQGNMSYREFTSESNSLFDAKTLTARVDLSRALGQGVTDALSYTFSYNTNKHDYPFPGGSGDPNDSAYRTAVLNYYAFSNEDQIYQSHGISYQYSKLLTGSWSATATAGLSYTQYSNPDRFSCTVRKNTNYSLALALNYRFNESIRGYINGSYAENRSNLPAYVYDRGLDGSGAPLCNGFALRNGEGGFRPATITGEDLVGVPLQGASITSYSKQLLTMGLAVNF